LGTYSLWKRFTHPPETHPFYNHIISENNFQIASRAWLWFPLAIILPLAIFPGIILIDIVYSAVWSVLISQRLNRLKRTTFYDLVCVSPRGKAEIDWIICMGVMYRKGTFIRLNSIGLWLTRAMFMVVFLLSFVLSLPFFTLNADRVGEQIIVLITVAITLILHHRQTIIMSGLIGLLAPIWIKDRLLTPVTAGGVFLTLQLMSYSISGLLIFSVIPDVMNITMVVSFSQFLLWVALSAVTFVIIREIMVVALQNLYVRCYNIDPSKDVIT